MKKHPISILIPTCNRADSLRCSLEAISKLRIPENISTELLIINNASTDNTDDMVRNFKLSNMTLRSLWVPKAGKSNAINQGLESAAGNIILMTDDDCRPPVDWVEKMCTPIIEGKADVVQGGIKIADHLIGSWMTPMIKMMFASTEMRYADEKPGWIISANIAFSKEIFMKVHGFDPELGPGALGFHDDTLFYLQLQKNRYRITYALDVVVDHFFSESRLYRENLLHRAEREGRSVAYISYHWLQEPINFPRLQLAKHYLKLLLIRLKTGDGKKSACKGISNQEFYRMEKLGFFKQYLLERKRPRNYDKNGAPFLR